MRTNLFAHVPRGERLGPPPNRKPDPRDDLVADLIDSLPANVRLYPDLYAWAIVDLLSGVAPETDSTAHPPRTT